MDDQEVLHISIDVMREGTLYRKEFGFMSNQFVFTRTSKLIEHHDEDGFDTTGWCRLNGPDGSPVCVSLDIIEKIAIAAKRKNWEVIWNPNYDPSMQEFIKRVEF